MKATIASVFLLIIGATLARIPVSFVVANMTLFSIQSRMPINKTLLLVAVAILPQAFAGWFGAKFALRFVPRFNKKIAVGSTAFLIAIVNAWQVYIYSVDVHTIVITALSIPAFMYAAMRALRDMPTAPVPAASASASPT